MEQQAPHIFLSYSRQDTDIMRRVRDTLRAEQLTVWTDEALLVGTPAWEREIEKAIQSGGALIVLLSPSSAQSEWVRREISYAEEFEKRIFPVLVSGDSKSAVPARLINHQRIDIRNASLYRGELSKLINALHVHLDVGGAGNPAGDARSEPQDAPVIAAQNSVAERASRSFSVPRLKIRTLPHRIDVAFTLAALVPITLPVLAATLGVTPYGDLLGVSTPGTWLFILAAALIVVSLADLFIAPSRAVTVVGLVVLGFISLMCYAQGTVPLATSIGNEVPTILILLAPGSVASMFLIVVRAISDTRPERRAAYHLRVFAATTSALAVGAIIGFPVSLAIQIGLAAPIPVAIGSAFLVSSATGAGYRAAALNGARRLNSRTANGLRIAYGIAVAVQVWLFFLGGWSTINR